MKRPTADHEAELKADLTADLKAGVRSDVSSELRSDVGSDVRSAVLGYRWRIVALLFFATTINYVDRQVLGILAPTLQRELSWSETDYGAIVSWFSFAYGIGLLLTGRILDAVGTRIGFSVAIVTWSFAAMAHAIARSVTGFGLVRGLLGLGESANFPAAIKTVAQWFPQKERALAVGIFNAGSNVGAIVAPLVVPWIALTLGWRWAFIITGAIGFVWLVFWLATYREPEHHARVSREELQHIRRDETREVTSTSNDVSWLQVLRQRQTWAFVVGKTMTDPVWYFYLFWLPKFLDTSFGVQLKGLAAPLIAIYLVADVGSVGGGWISSWFLTRGWSVNRSRKTAMLIAALLIAPTMFAPRAQSLWIAVALVSVAAAAHQWWSANLFTTVSDLFPRRAVATVVGIGGFGGAMAGMAFQRGTGRLLDATHGNYAPIFVVCGLTYLVALAIVHLLVPRMRPARLE
ncbi:MAG TPA: MFS transporter [Gemmatimonadaceae bacterium]|nr:MFS transporter [Gemmatimonadaceae bacterium]